MPFTVAHAVLARPLWRTVDRRLALILLALWHGLIKKPVAALVRPRLRPPIDTSPFAFRPVPRFGLIVASILTGVAGHLVWDGFTHRDGFVTTRVAFLQEAIGRPQTVVGAILGAMAAGLVTTVVVSAGLQAGSRRW